MSENFKGFAYPIEKTPKGYFPRQSGVDQIKSDMLILLLTSPGERVMMPDFGTPLKDLIFDPNDAVLVERARQMIIDSINLWEPRVSVDQIEVSVGGDRATLSPYDDLTQNDAILTIRIVFTTEDNITETQALELKVPLPSGG